jgi:sensor histidine kinase YesM
MGVEMDTPAQFVREHHHPLEVIAFFRRVPCSFARNFAYTFIWNGLFAVAFFALTTLSTGRIAPAYVFGIQLVLANVIGYSIHALYWLGAKANVETAARNAGFIAKVAYFSGVPLVGVAFGFWVSSYFLYEGFRGWLTNQGVLLSMLSTSLVVSIVLSIVFFGRERSAVAEAEVLRGRQRTERVEREAALANLRALQAQIEPHFLFNTLANVTSLMDLDPPKAKHMLESFIRFLRASLAATRMESTTLGAEGELIAAYLDVLQVRMGARLAYRIDIPPDLAGFVIAPMLLQPVVENAIRHGLEPKVEGGQVEFAARREGDGVVIEVRDTGVGFAPTTRGGIGLANLGSRLRGLYGERATLAVADNAGGGARVTVRFAA